MMRKSIRERRVELSLQRQFTEAVLRYCDEGAKAGDPDATDLARSVDAIDAADREAWHYRPTVLPK